MARNSAKKGSSGARDPLGEQVVSVAEIARLYGLPPAILERAIARGELSTVSGAADEVLLDRTTVVAWLKERRSGWA